MDEDEKQHIFKLLDWLLEEVESAGGDGDGVWLTEIYDVADLFPIIHSHLERGNRWKELRLEGKSIHISNQQEWLVITNDRDYYNNLPNWIQVKVDW